MLFYGMPQQAAGGATSGAWGAQQPQDGAWGAQGPAYTPAPPPAPWTGAPVQGAAPGWESMYAGGQVSQPYQPPAGPTPTQDFSTGGAWGAGAPYTPQAQSTGQAYGGVADAYKSMNPGGASFGAGGASGGLGGGDAVMGDMEWRGGGPPMQGGAQGQGGFGSPSSLGNPYLGSQLDYLKSFMGDVRDKNMQSIRGQYSGGNGVNNIGMQLQQNDYLGDFERNLGSTAANMLGNNWQANMGNQTANRGLDIQQFNSGVNATDVGNRGQLNTLTTMYGIGQQGQNDAWSPLKNASSIFGPYSGLQSAAGSGSSGSNWQSVLGGLIGGAQFGKNMGWWGA